MAGVYSHVLAHLRTEGSGETLLYTPSSGSVVVVRDIVLVPTNASGQNIGVYVVSSGSVPVYLYLYKSVDAYTSGHWSGRQVLSDSDTLWLTDLNGGCQCRVSGYVFGV